MKKLLLITFLIVTNLSVAQSPKPTISGLSSALFTTTPSTASNVYFTVAANGADATSYIQYSTNAATVASATSYTAGFTNATFSSSLTYQITGLQPNTTYYWRIWANNAFGTTYGAVNSFTTAASTPTISNIANEINSNTSATINYVLNANSTATTSVINYGTSPANLSMQVAGGTATGTTNTNVSGVLNGLSLGGTYYYQIVATNSFGSTSSNVLSFTMVDINVAVAEYNFNNTYANTQGFYAFVANSGTSFTNDRQGNPNSAININQNSTSATVVGLPSGSSSRTISIWAKLNSFSVFEYNHLYGYGTAGNSTGNGGSILASNIVNGNATTTSLGHLGYANNHTQSVVGYDFRNWNHFVFVYDGTNSKVYLNGTLFGTSPKTWNTIVTSSNFTIGGFFGENFFDGALDDLKIYNRALNATEISNLYIYNSLLSTDDFDSKNLKATIYPNPASDFFTIEMENEVKSIEIYSIQGQKVLTASSKEINVSNLSKGMYLVRIEDQNNAIATQKLIVK